MDIHSHLIPGIDDGVKSIDQALNILEQLQNMGYEMVVTTPHVMSARYTNSSGQIREKLDEIRDHARQHGLHIRIEAAAEYFVDENFIKLLKDKDLLYFGREKYVLLEWSYVNKPARFGELVFDMLSDGFTPVLAHAERYDYCHSRTMEVYYRLYEQGVKLQVNLPSLAGLQRTANREVAEKLLQKGLAVFVGSDLHNAQQLDILRDGLRSKYLKLALDKGQLLNPKIL